ncbi:hypothetical protein Taro_017856 [Colocasia esculenta]|uniref:DYW domain-containing protein n=1 Tax=Colocasia esculenta TaxID=4460 RepID=A0A843UPT6_COLES|nr:hypothetical protein [Colocasia esculenta]
MATIGTAAAWRRIPGIATTALSGLSFLNFFSTAALPPFSSSSTGTTSPHPILNLLQEEARSPRRRADLLALHALALTSGLLRHPFPASRLVDVLLRPGAAGDPAHAAAVFDSLDSPDAYTWNAVLAAQVRRGGPPADALGLYFRMRSAGAQPPDGYTFALVAKACSSPGCGVGIGREVHGQVVKCGMEALLVVRNSLMRMYCGIGLLNFARQLFDETPLSCLDSISWNTMISSYGKSGDVPAARGLFDRMPSRNLFSWSAMTDGYVANAEYSQALVLFNEMQGRGFRPDAVVLVSVLKACAHLGALDQGRWIHLYAERNKLGLDVNPVLGAALVDMYCKCGYLDVALQVFDATHDRDVVLWNVMISGLAMHGHGKGALELFRRMREHGVVPNGSTFLGILRACSHVGLVDEGRETLRSMQDHHVKPQREHYGCLADLLGRAGLLEEAEEVIRAMPMEPQAAQWGALMSACRMHKNVEMGERIGKHLISLEPQDGGRYVLLANVYAEAGRWEDAREMRRAMEEMGVKKEIGCSFVEWNGTIHEFIVGDKSHPQTGKIYAMLSEMEKKLQMVGYVKDTSQLLIEMGNEEDKEIALSYHSEKLAIAFGIINIGRGTPIRVVKNLRVCRDCHTYAKLISKIYRTEIIVRDRNRFHLFRDGSCSCRDYW